MKALKNDKDLQLEATLPGEARKRSKKFKISKKMAMDSDQADYTTTIQI